MILNDSGKVQKPSITVCRIVRTQSAQKYLSRPSHIPASIVEAAEANSDLSVLEVLLSGCLSHLFPCSFPSFSFPIPIVGMGMILNISMDFGFVQILARATRDMVQILASAILSSDLCRSSMRVSQLLGQDSPFAHTTIS